MTMTWPNQALQRTRRLRLCFAIRFQSCSAPGRRVAELGSLDHFAALKFSRRLLRRGEVSVIRFSRSVGTVPDRVGRGMFVMGMGTHAFESSIPLP